MLEVENKNDQLLIAKDYFNQIYLYDMNSVDNKRRSANTMKNLLKAYSRNVCTLAKDTTLYNDSKIDVKTFNDYLEILKRLYIVDEIEPWNTSIRSQTSIRSCPKRHIVDPSIVCASLNISPQILLDDLNTFGFIFECLCIRDLKIYAANLGGEINYYRDKTGLECDCVLTLQDGRFAAIEIKLFSEKYIEEAANNLNKFDKVIENYNESLGKNKKAINKIIKKPNIKIIITNCEVAYQRKEDGIYVIPIGCLKN